MSQAAVPIAVLNDRLREVEAEIKKLTHERDILRGLAKRAVEAPPAGSGVSRHSISIPVRHPQTTLFVPIKPTLTSTLEEFIAKNPGLTSAEIASKVIASGFKVGGGDPIKTIQTTLGQLAAKHRVERSADGRFSKT